MDLYMFQRPEKHRIHHEHEKLPNKTEILFGETYCLAFMKSQKNLTAPVDLKQKKSLD